ncbi:MAG: hypothetical protein JNK12_12490 [Acidimicrobiales bacterium]|nr:hypothetical protein [Acidimicrobiales bacterium]
MRSTNASRREIDDWNRDAVIITTYVCAKCNNGWMRRLEDEVADALKVMILGLPRRLSKKEAFFLRRWAIKTAVMLTSSQNQILMSPRLRRSLYNGGSKHAAVHLGQFQGTTYRLTCNFVSWESVERPARMSWVILTLGSVLLTVFGDYDLAFSEVKLGSGARRFLTDLPPAGVEIDWPDVLAIDYAGRDILRDGPMKFMHDVPPNPSPDTSQYPTEAGQDGIPGAPAP